MYKLKDGARVQDLLDAAHGVREDGDLSDINLAARVIDGTTLTVPSRATASREGTKLRIRSGESAAALNLPEYTISGWRPAEVKPAGQTPATEAPAHAGVPAAAAPSGLIDLNTATQAALESLPGIGPKTAEKIIAYRTRVPFRSVDDLANVNGIGPKKLEAVRSLVTVAGK
jgi:competence protein ComEA